MRSSLGKARLAGLVRKPHQGGPPRYSDAISIESKGISNRSNRTLAEICTKKTNTSQNAIFGRIKPVVPGFVPIGSDSNESKDVRLNSPKSGILFFVFCSQTISASVRFDWFDIPFDSIDVVAKGLKSIALEA